MKQVNSVKRVIKKRAQIGFINSEDTLLLPCRTWLKKKGKPGQSYTAEALKKFPLCFTLQGPEEEEELCARTSQTKKEKKQLSHNELLTSGLFIVCWQVNQVPQTWH